MTSNKIDILTWFEVLGYTVLLESEIAPIRVKEEGVWSDRLLQSLHRINPQIPTPAILEAFNQIICLANDEGDNNRQRFRTFLRNGITVCYPVKDYIVYDKVKLIDCQNLLNNDWLILELEFNHGNNEEKVNDIFYRQAVIFINGLPLVTIFIKENHFKSEELINYNPQIKHLNQTLLKSFNYYLMMVILPKNKIQIFNGQSQEFFDGSKISNLEIFIQSYFDKRYFLSLITNSAKFKNVDKNICKNTINNFHQFTNLFSISIPSFKIEKFSH